MGSGKGKSRRTNAATAALRTVAHATPDEEKWHDFVESCELASVGILRYYLGRSPRKLTAEDCELVLTELFSDAVTVGAIALPEPYKAEDFAFDVPQPGVDGARSFIRLRKNSEGDQLLFDPYAWLGAEHVVMLPKYTANLIRMLSRGANFTLRAQHNDWHFTG